MELQFIKKFYIGYNLRWPSINKTRKPLAFSIHEGSPYNSKFTMKFRRTMYNETWGYNNHE